jgi:hypothetical protein
MSPSATLRNRAHANRAAHCESAEPPPRLLDHNRLLVEVTNETRSKTTRTTHRSNAESRRDGADCGTGQGRFARPRSGSPHKASLESGRAHDVIEPALGGPGGTEPDQHEIRPVVDVELLHVLVNEDRLIVRREERREREAAGFYDAAARGGAVEGLAI